MTSASDRYFGVLLALVAGAACIRYRKFMAERAAEKQVPLFGRRWDVRSFEAAFGLGGVAFIACGILELVLMLLFPD